MSMEHTQGRLKSFEAYADPELRDEEDFLVTVVHAGAKHAGKEVANARRIVACWNACIDVDTLTLEQNPAPFSELRAERDSVLQLLRRVTHDSEWSCMDAELQDDIAKALGMKVTPALPVPKPVTVTPCTGVCKFVDDSQSHNKKQAKCTTCGETVPF